MRIYALTICMAVGKQHSVDTAQAILRKPFKCSSLEILSGIDKNRPATIKASDNQPHDQSYARAKICNVHLLPICTINSDDS